MCIYVTGRTIKGTGKTHGVTQAELVGRQAAFDTALALAKSKGKWISWWNGSALSGGPSQAGAACAAAMDSAVALSLLVGARRNPWIAV